MLAPTYLNSFLNSFKIAGSFILKSSFMSADFCQNVDYLSPSSSIAWTQSSWSRVYLLPSCARDKSAILSIQFRVRFRNLASLRFFYATPRLIVPTIETNRNYWAEAQFIICQMIDFDNDALPWCLLTIVTYFFILISRGFLLFNRKETGEILLIRLTEALLQ